MISDIIKRINSSLTVKNIFTGLLIVLITAGLFEVFARVYLGVILQKSTTRKFQFDSYRIYANRPSFREGDGDKDWIIHNQQGFRRSEAVSKEKPESLKRIFLMGGSAAAGISSSQPYPIRHIYNNETIDAYLEAMLEKKYPNQRFEVVNAAVTGYQVYQHTAYILSELLEYHPDLIVFFDGYNDHFTSNPDYSLYRDNRYQFWKPRLQKPGFAGWLDYLSLWASDWSALARGYYAWKMQHDALRANVSMTGGGSVEELIAAHKIAAQKQFLRFIDVNLMLLERFGIKVVLCLQPALVLRDKDKMSADEAAFYRDNEKYQALYPVVLDELEEVAGKYNVPFIDMVPIFNDSKLNGKQLFIDYCHLTAEGGALTAETLLPAVEKELFN